MSVRAKFRLNSVVKREQTVGKFLGNDEDGHAQYKNETVDARDLHFMAVYGNDGENKEYWEATPSGQLQLFMVNPAAWGQFEEGKEYYLDITPAE
jgi:hypothetical protein